ncbi:MAG: DNA mismatch repair endonuclease MutL [Planctomycetota bacterium]
MSKIKVLSQNLVNKIAAGEVIERPASVVKELVENSLDTGADRIRIIVEEGGKRLISIQDNGCGMDKEDIKLAFVSHATSKIKSVDDLFAITTMGFRGEALASIGTVSHVTVTSREKSALTAHELVIADGKLKEPKETGAPEGTTITVEDLFYNVPARRKFLRSTAAEASYITETVTKIAMITPSVDYQMIRDNRRVMTLPQAASIRERLTSLFGEEFAEGLLEAEESAEKIKVKVLIGSPIQNRADTKMQFAFVNNRPIRDKVIIKAIMDAFSGLLPQRRYPVAIVLLEIEPHEIDVNVHPAKTEIRFKTPGFIHSIVRSTISKALRGSQQKALTENGINEDSSLRQERIKSAIESFLSRAEPKQRDFTKQLRPREEPQKQLSLSDKIPLEPSEKFIQFHDSYIVMETKTGIIVIDQHALHERIIYEEVKQRYASKSIESQRLLFPEVIELLPKEKAVISEVASSLTILGFELEEFGGNSVIVRSIPRVLDRSDIPDAIREVIDNYLEETTPNIEKYLESVMQTIACKAAVKAGQKLSKEEIEILLSDSNKIPALHTCPHGRPIFVNLPLIDIERQLKRR